MIDHPKKASPPTTRLMLDIETMGIRPNSLILSIAAVIIQGTEVMANPFYCRVSMESCAKYGLKIDTDTLKWWLQQSEAARAEIDRDPLHIFQALTDFTEYIKKHQPDEIWGNGSDFDNVILSENYQVVGMEVPWKYHQNRCYRTLKNLYPEIKIQRLGTHHNALDDAITQAHHLVDLLNRTTTPTGPHIAAGAAP